MRLDSTRSMECRSNTFRLVNSSYHPFCYIISIIIHNFANLYIIYKKVYGCTETELFLGFTIYYTAYYSAL